MLCNGNFISQELYLKSLLKVSVSLFQMTTSVTLYHVCTVEVVRTRLTGTRVSARPGTLDSTVKEVSIVKLYPPVL